MKKEECQHERQHEEIAIRAREKVLSRKNMEETCAIFRMLAEPSRMKIVLALLEGEMCVYHIVEACGGGQSAVSHQLRVLKDNKIVKSRREGQNILYSIADDHVREIVRIGEEHIYCEAEAGK